MWFRIGRSNNFPLGITDFTCMEPDHAIGRQLPSGEIRLNFLNFEYKTDAYLPFLPDLYESWCVLLQ